MQHATSIRDDGVLVGNEESEVSVESTGIGARSTLWQGSFFTIRHMVQIPRRNAMTNRLRYRDRPRERRIHAVTAFAHEPCQITHAPATSCPMYTCAHHSRR